MNRMRTFAFGFACLAAVAAPMAAQAGSASLYVQDGLIACWDGIENAGVNTHDPSATVWKDLVNGYEFTLTGVMVDDDRMTFAGTPTSYGTLSAADTTATFGSAMNGTLEVVYASRDGNLSQIVLQTPAPIGLSMGELISGNVHMLYPYTGNANKKVYVFSSGTATNSVSVRYTSGAPDGAIANGSTLATHTTDGRWAGSGNQTFIGTKNSKDKHHFLGSIYCIRLYSRQLTDAEIAANCEVDQKRFILRTDESTLQVSSSVEGIGSSPSPSYGPVLGLASGDAVPAACGNPAVTNSNGSVYSCTGWKLYNGNGDVVSNGTETAFTYMHPTPAAYRKLEWQWEMVLPPKRYVQDGLIACWDGIENAGVGVHEDNVSVWKDIVGGREFSLTETTVDANCMTFAGNNTSYGTLSATDTASTFLAANSGTLEIVYRSRTGTGNQVLIQSTSDAGVAFSIYGASAILPFTSSSQATPQPSFSFTSGTETNFVAVRYLSGAPVSVLGNGSAPATATASGWVSPGSETIIGHRYTKANGYAFAGSIYAIRLYSRQLTSSEILANQSIDRQRFSQGVDDSRLVVSSTQDGFGAPSPAYGYLTGLEAGDTRSVTCGSVTILTNAAENVVYVCSGWKLYDKDNNVVSRGVGTSFTYTHPRPAEYRRLEWQWKVSEVKGTIAAGANGSVLPSGTTWFAAGTPVTVTATPDADYTFARWSGTLPGGVDMASASTTFTPTAPFDIMVDFGLPFYVATTGDDENPGTEAAPFATISNAIVKANAAIAGGAQSAVILVADGAYPENGLTVANAIVIAGNATDRTAVKIGKTGARVFRIANADAVLRNLTVQSGTVPTKSEADAGGNVRLEAGTVANCVLTGGGTTSVTDNKGGNLFISGGSVVDCLLTSPLLGPGAYGGSAYITGGTVSRCIIEKSPKPNTWTAIGAGAYLKGGVIENCLIRDNRGGRSALYLDSATAKAVNCTIVGNTAEGNVGGVYVNNASASVINCVIFDNGGTATSEWGNNNGARFFNCVSTVENASGVNWTTLPFTTKSSHFEDDEFWTPLLGSPMVDGGSDSLYPSTCSQTDLAGNARVSGSHIDIGCSELDQSSFNVVATVASYPSVLKGATVDFVCHAAGAAGAVTYELDFGDGSAHLVTTDTQVSHRFDVCGLFPTRIRAKDGDGDYGDWETMVVPIRVSESDIYVSTEGSDANAGTAAAPFRTITHALATLTNVISSCATDVDGVTVHIAAGTYEENGLPAIGSRVTVEGIASDRNAVKVGKTGARIFRLADAGAVLRNLTVTNGTVTAADISYAGGNVRLEAGTVANCVLTGGGNTSVDQEKGGNLYIASGKAVDCLMTNARPGKGAMGANAYMTGGCVSRCIIENTPAPSVYTAEGAGAYMTGGVIENCLLRNNNAGRGAICMNGACQAVNCTVVSSIPLILSNQGGIGGIYVMSASASVVNCVVYGNGGTATAEWANKNAARFFNCAFAANAAFTGANSTVNDLTDAAFKSFANGNYRPKSGGALVDAGDKGLYASHATSETDLNGARRIQGKGIDIGCYENDQQGTTIIVR